MSNVVLLWWSLFWPWCKLKIMSKKIRVSGIACTHTFLVIIRTNKNNNKEIVEFNYLKPNIIMMSGFIHTYLLNAFLTICKWIESQLNSYNRLMRHIIIDDAIKIIESSLVKLKFEFWIIINNFVSNYFKICVLFL